MSEPLVFQGTTMHVGDLIEIKFAGKYRLVHPAQVVVLKLETVRRVATLTVLVPYSLTRLAHSERQLRLSKRDVEKVMVLMLATEAVPRYSSATAPFQHHDQVSFLAGGKPCTGQVIAAIEGIVAVRLPNGTILNGGVRHFTRITTAEAKEAEADQTTA